MRIQTFSVVLGSRSCDGDCPFCVSHITGFDHLVKGENINFRNFDKAVSLAQAGGCTTLLFTGKGEPTLYPHELTAYLRHLVELGNPLPLLELQTNALQMGDLASKSERKTRLIAEDLKRWYDLGLNTICISVVSLEQYENAEVYRGDYPALETTVKYLHDFGYSIRLCVMMENGKVDSPDRVFEVADWCKLHGVAQCTVRPIRRTKPKRTDVYEVSRYDPDVVENARRAELPIVVVEPDQYSRYVDEHGLSEAQEVAIREAIAHKSQLLTTLMHGNNQARVYDVNGQNLCISDCLTIEPETDDIRTLIFYSDGKIMYDWQFNGARLL